MVSIDTVRSWMVALLLRDLVERLVFLVLAMLAAALLGLEAIDAEAAQDACCLVRFL